MTGRQPEANVAFFGALFAVRTDVYAVRYDNPHTGKGGWSRRYTAAGAKESGSGWDPAA